MVLCAPCSEESARWLDTKPSTLLPRLGFAHGSGAAYDASAVGMRDRSRSRHEEWRTTVREQRKRIAQQCAAGQHIGRLDT